MVPPRHLDAVPSNSAASALHASTSLLIAVRNIKSLLPTSAQRLINELQDLTEVLGPLSEMISTAPYTDVPRLDSFLPLCGVACNQFEQELQNYLSDSNNGVISPRDWAKLRCMGCSINDFGELLSRYTATIRITLTDASFRGEPFITTESFKAHENLVETAKIDLRMHLETLNERLEQMPDPTAPEPQQLKEWQLSLEKCLQICTQLADRIDEIESEQQQDDNRTPGSHDPTHHPGAPRCPHASTISNYSTGDAVQLMFSTNERVFHGSNRGLGWRIRQAGGHFSDTTGQKISNDFASMNTRPTGNEAPGLRNHWSSTADNNNLRSPMLLPYSLNRGLSSNEGILPEERLRETTCDF